MSRGETGIIAPDFSCPLRLCAPDFLFNERSSCEVKYLTLISITDRRMKGTINAGSRTVPCLHVRAQAAPSALSSKHHITGQTKNAAWQPALRSLQRHAVCLQVRAAAASGAPSAPWKQQNARLVLEDGSVWHGSAFGASGTTIAEVVFNTSMSGYQVRSSTALLANPGNLGQGHTATDLCRSVQH